MQNRSRGHTQRCRLRRTTTTLTACGILAEKKNGTITKKRVPCSVVCIEIGYGLDGPGKESQWEGENFRNSPDRLWGPSNLLYNGYRVFPGDKERRGRDDDPSPPSSAVVMKG